MSAYSSKIELLSPAKNAAIGRAAIDAGADAVYIGGPAFGARKDAGNSFEDIAALVKYANIWRAKVLVTLNTLLRDDEYDEAVRIAYECKRTGVHALIIQDMNIARMLLSTGDFSGSDGGIRLHASTQCDNRTVEHIQQLEQMGFKRVVLARELSYKQITDIRSKTTCELEAFVHGALCVSYSGRCYMSEILCGRSANRGECAQMCRLPYDILDENRQVIAKDRHILSLYDLDRSAHLRELLETGVTTLKIEGRLKDVAYVRNITAYYHQLLERLGCERTSRGRVTLAFRPGPEKTFHRGATEYFSFSRPDNLVNQQTPKSTGELVGHTPLPEGLLPDKTLHNGDGLTYGADGCYWQPGARITAPKGTPVYRNSDADFNRQIMSDTAAVRKLPVRILFEEYSNGFHLTMQAVGADESVSLAVECEKQTANNPERAEAMVRQQLSKLGDTPFVAETVSVVWSQPLFLSAAFLNDSRRRLVAAFLTQCEHHNEGQHQVFNYRQLDFQRHAAESDSYSPLMTCKYCILYELGSCKKLHPRSQHLPTYLRYRNSLVRIVTDCQKCEMQLITDNL